MTDEATAVRACPVCGKCDWKAREERHTMKRRPKFGLLWILVSIVSLGLGVLLWLVWPRRKVTVGVDRYLECRAC